MARPATVTDLKLREPTPAEAAEDLRVELHLREMREGPPFPMWRLLHSGSLLRAYAPEDRLSCQRLELELADLRQRYWKTEDFAEVLDVRRRMLDIDRALQARSIGVYVPNGRGWPGYLLEGSSES